MPSGQEKIERQPQMGLQRQPKVVTLVNNYRVDNQVRFSGIPKELINQPFYSIEIHANCSASKELFGRSSRF